MMLLQLAWHGLFEALACTASSSAHHFAAGVAINADNEALVGVRTT
jgi:hypothetical protein